jgi:hypothetical protein
LNVTEHHFTPNQNNELALRKGGFHRRRGIIEIFTEAIMTAPERISNEKWQEGQGVRPYAEHLRGYQNWV